ncbi:hypothetical protein F3Y22_tig00113719pilonHSYRG00149 [Hibiscus syriacus]|uniref:Uncharacterized protein n=1 Tax=Hibiscus syriacus TaxID=106335 RepID=A0A6A2XZA8_HIBSY|nr:hypothetical protein F3Y22_tig00113719pilonHSYRG00149 [Hibiscus syriacus]
MDAQVSYAFHSERKLNPEKFKNQFVNQVSFCHSVICFFRTMNVAQLAKVQVMKKHGSWEDLKLAPRKPLTFSPPQQHKVDRLSQLAYFFRWSKSLGNAESEKAV